MSYKYTLNYIFFSFALLWGVTLNAQYQKQYLPLIEEHKEIHSTKEDLSISIVKDTTYDVKFYHIDVELGIDSTYIGGKVSYLMRSTQDNVSSIKLDLKDYYIIDSISSPVNSYSLNNDVLELTFEGSFMFDEMFAFTIYYHGIPQLEGGYKGLRYETHNGSEPIIATLSTPFLAHTWFPCKDGTQDKADSVFVDITIPDVSYGGIPLKAVSNGLLVNIEDLGDKKKFQWEHRYAIVPYYVMIAISNFAEFEQSFVGMDYSFPTKYYVFQEHLNTAQNAMSDFQSAMGYFIDIFGDYPFRNEKYGMTQLGYYGAIENQTNTIINSLSSNYYNTAVHELAHQWFGDLITCDTWHHGWLNEGFAVYSTVLYNEHKYGYETYQNMMEDYEYYLGGTVYLQDDTDPFNIFIGIIYYKGAYVLHMLRGMMGDEDFFAALKAYALTPEFQFSTATTEDFMAVCETYYGADLSVFFDQWIYDERFPIYEYNYEYNATTNELGLAIYQVQNSLGWRSVFEMPIQLEIDFTDGSDTLITVQNDQQFQSFYFTMEKEVENLYFDPHKWVLKSAELNEDINVGISQQGHKVISLYPNPNDGLFMIDLGEEGLEEVEISIIDLSGNEVYHEKQYTPNKMIFVRLNLSFSGMYMVRIKVGELDTYEKIVFY